MARGQRPWARPCEDRPLPCPVPCRGPQGGHGSSRQPICAAERARKIPDIVYAAYPQGEATLTVRNGRRELFEAIWDGDKAKADRLDHIHGSVEVDAIIKDILRSPVLRRALSDNLFNFDPTKLTVARIDRAELGDFDALILTLFLIEQFPGQLIMPDFGFCARDIHTNLFDEHRLIAGVNTLNELPPSLRERALLVKEKYPSHTTHDDAVELARFMCRFPPHSMEYEAFIQQAMN